MPVEHLQLSTKKKNFSEIHGVCSQSTQTQREGLQDTIGITNKAPSNQDVRFYQPTYPAEVWSLMTLMTLYSYFVTRVQTLTPAETVWSLDIKIENEVMVKASIGSDLL
jgi:hypothetical protein